MIDTPTAAAVYVQPPLLSMYMFEGVFSDLTNGVAFAIADSLDASISQILAQVGELCRDATTDGAGMPPLNALGTWAASDDYDICVGPIGCAEVGMRRKDIAANVRRHRSYTIDILGAAEAELRACKPVVVALDQRCAFVFGGGG
jgi:hypothetical protein